MLLRNSKLAASYVLDLLTPQVSTILLRSSNLKQLAALWSRLDIMVFVLWPLYCVIACLILDEPILLTLAHFHLQCVRSACGPLSPCASMYIGTVYYLFQKWFYKPSQKQIVHHTGQQHPQNWINTSLSQYQQKRNMISLMKVRFITGLLYWM